MARLLILGGTAWLGGRTAAHAVAAGHEVVAVSRGTREPYAPSPAWARVQRVVADRDAEDAAGTFAGRVADGTVLVGSPTGAEVERAVTRPAAQAGLRLEDGLAATLVDDAGTEPGLLPLLSAALTQLWERRDGGVLTYAGYVGVGGIAGSLMLAVFISPAFGGTGYDEGYSMVTQLAAQSVGVGVVALWSAIASAVLAVGVSLVFPMRVGEDAEREGLDITSNGERAWEMD